MLLSITLALHPCDSRILVSLNTQHHSLDGLLGLHVPCPIGGNTLYNFGITSTICSYIISPAIGQQTHHSTLETLVRKPEQQVYRQKLGKDE